MRKEKNLNVSWYFPNKKRPFTYSTTAVSNNIKLISEYINNKTPNEILSYIIENNLVGCYEEINIIIKYVKKGYGDYILNLY